MKVIHILYELKFSGAEIMYVDAAPVFQKKGCELSVVATAPNIGEYAQYFEKAGYKIIHKPYPVLKNYFARIKYFQSFVKFLKEGNYDVVHIHSHGSMWGMALCAWIAGKHSVFTFHNVFTSHNYSYIYHYLLRWSAKNIFNCNFQTISDSVYENELKLYHNKTTKIYNWFGNTRYFPATYEEKLKIRKELEIKNDTLVLISVGGCSHIKRHSEIIKALPIVLKKYPNTLYLHLGKGESEDSEIELAKELGVFENVRFCGNQSNVRQYLVASDIYLMTSKFEGIPITTIETMACKITTILYDVPGLRDFNKESEVSVIIPPDYQTLADKIDFVKSSPDVASKLADEAYSLVNRKFHMEKNVESIFNLYL